MIVLSMLIRPTYSLSVWLLLGFFMKLVVNNWPEEAQRELAVVGDEPAAAAGEPVAG